MTFPHRRHVLPVAVAACLALLATACGGGDDEGSSATTTAAPVALTDWVDEVNALCVDAEGRIDALTPPADNDFDAYETFFEGGRRVVISFIADAEAVGTPSEQAVQAEQFLDTYRDQLPTFDEIITAAQDADLPRIETLGAQLEASDVERDVIAEDLGLTDCIGDDEAPAEDPAGSAPANGSANLPLAEWSAEVNGACDRLSQQYADLGSTTPETPEELTQLGNDLNAFVTQVVGEWERIGPPAGDDGTAQQFFDLLLELQAATTALANAAAAGDLAGIEAASADLEAVGAQLNPLGVQLDIPACAGF